MAGRATGKNAEEGRCGRRCLKTTDGEVTGVKIEELIMGPVISIVLVGARLAESSELKLSRRNEREGAQFCDRQRGEGGLKTGITPHFFGYRNPTLYILDLLRVGKDKPVGSLPWSVSWGRIGTGRRSRISFHGRRTATGLESRTTYYGDHPLRLTELA